MSRIDDAMGRIALIAGHRALARTTRRFLVGCVATMRKSPAEARAIMTGMAAVGAFVEATEDRWVDTTADGGDFDGCDLRIWLELADAAGVRFVPARTILSLTEDELAHLSGPVHVPSHMGRALARLGRSIFGEPTRRAPEAPRHDTDALHERLADAMDDVPDGWIVRSHVCGPSLLKAWAGSGLLGKATRVQGGPDLDIGPGWVRTGNRRRVDATDTRYVTLFPQGHGRTIHYLARPWAEAARRAEAEDPHRHGSMFAGKGSWPCEWRVFFEQGTVTGVASYYGWTGEATPLNARRALEARAAAERIIAAGRRASVNPRLMDVEILKFHRDEGEPLPDFAEETLARFAEGFAGTLDFLETDDGMTLLEGGPPHTPVGGGHPCAFAGATGGPRARIDGVALKLMDHVSLGDPATWTDGDHAGAILTWEEAAALAARTTK